MSLDIVTTNYALSNGLGYEGNNIMSGVVQNQIIFIAVKIIASVVIIMMLSHCLKQNKKVVYFGMRLIILLMLAVVGNNLVIITGSAVTNTYLNPTCLSPSYDDGYDIFLASSAFGNHGNMSSTAVSDTGYFTPQNSRLTNANDVVCSIEDPVVRGTVDTEARVWGVTGTGVLFYTDSTFADYSLGFYHDGVFGGCSVGGNCNPIYVVANLSAFPNGRRLASDSSGNIYTLEGTKIQVLSPDIAYVPADFFDYSGKTRGDTLVDVVGLQADSSGNIYSLITSTGNVGGGCPPLYCMQMIAIDASGTMIKNDTVFNTGGVIINGSMGGIVIDSTNPTTNYTYAYYQSTAPAGVRLKHNSSAGTTSISSTPLASITAVDGMIYQSGIIYISSRSQNNIYAYATNYTGFNIPASGATGAAELTYNVATIQSLYDTYYNNSNFIVNYNVNVNTPEFPNFYRWKVVLFDNNGVQVNGMIHFGSSCTTQGLLGSTCAVNETLEYEAPSTGWGAGTWDARLYEYNVNTFNTAHIVTSATWTVLNQSFNGTVAPPTTTIESGTGAAALSSIDGWTALFGLGVNAVSKFLFAMLIIVIFMIIGCLLTKFSLSGAIIMGLLPYAFFVFISYLPAWTVIILGIVVAMKIGMFR